MFFPNTNCIIEMCDVVFEEDNITLSVFRPTPLRIPLSLDDEWDSSSNKQSSPHFHNCNRSGSY
jgi:hypothetical protein